MPRKHGTKRNLEGTSTTERGSLRLRPTAKQPNAQEPGRRRSPAPAARENDLPMQNLMATLQPSRLICRDSEGCRPCEHVAATETGAQAGANLTSLTRGADPERRERKGEKKIESNSTLHPEAAGDLAIVTRQPRRAPDYQSGPNAPKSFLLVAQTEKAAHPIR